MKNWLVPNWAPRAPIAGSFHVFGFRTARALKVAEALGMAVYARTLVGAENLTEFSPRPSSFSCSLFLALRMFEI